MAWLTSIHVNQVKIHVIMCLLFFLFSPVRRHFLGLGMSGAVVIAAYNSYCFGITDFRWLQALQDIVSIPGTVNVSTGN